MENLPDIGGILQWIWGWLAEGRTFNRIRDPVCTGGQPESGRGQSMMTETIVRGL